MNTEQAIKILIAAAEQGQSRGAYTIKDSSVLFQAITTLTESKITNKPEEKTMEPETTTEVPPAETPAETGMAQTEETPETAAE